MKYFFILIILSISQSLYAMTHGKEITVENLQLRSAVKILNCSGTKIGKYHFILAAHCLEMKLKEKKLSPWVFLGFYSKKAKFISRGYQINRIYLPKKLALKDIKNKKVNMKHDVAIIEIKNETPPIPIAKTNEIKLTKNTEIHFVCFGYNETSNSTEESLYFVEGRYGFQKIKTIKENNYYFYKTNKYPNITLPGDSGCGIYNSKNELIAIHAGTTRKAYQFWKVRKTGYLIALAAHYKWFKDVLNNNSPSYEFNLSNEKYNIIYNDS